VVHFKDYPTTNKLRVALSELLGSPAPLVGELNHYYDASKCGIGWRARHPTRASRACPRLAPGQALAHPIPSVHGALCADGDSERKLVAGARVGPGADNMYLKYQWFHDSRPVGAEGRIVLEAGDVYIASEKAVGTDWKRRKVPTLRHAAGKEACKYALGKRKAGEEGPQPVVFA